MSEWKIMGKEEHSDNGCSFLFKSFMGNSLGMCKYENYKKPLKHSIDQAFRGFQVAEGRFELSTPRV